MSIFPDGDFGARALGRLQAEHLAWLTTTGADGTPQPNPVWFLFDTDTDTDTEFVVVYSARDAKRLEHVAVRPRVSLHFETDTDEGNVVVFAGVAEQALDVPSADDNRAYLGKYREGIERIGKTPRTFAELYSVPLRIRLTKVRGF